jgi:hypothetical protein
MDNDATRSDVTPAALADEVRCPECGYDVRGSTSPRCPECGFGLDALRTKESQLPWTYRREMGWFKAYWKTVWLVLRQPKRLDLEMARPVSYADSQSFRWVTFLHAYVPFLLGSIAWGIADHVYRWHEGEGMWWMLGGVQVFFATLFLLLPGIASYSFARQGLSVEQENRAIALSYYAWAVLAFMPAAGVLEWAALSTRGIDSVATDVLAVIAWVLPLILLGGGAFGPARFAGHVLHRSWLRMLPRNLLLGTVAVVVMLLSSFLPLSLFYGLIAYYSLR